MHISPSSKCGNRFSFCLSTLYKVGAVQTEGGQSVQAECEPEQAERGHCKLKVYSTGKRHTRSTG